MMFLMMNDKPSCTAARVVRAARILATDRRAQAQFHRLYDIARRDVAVAAKSRSADIYDGAKPAPFREACSHR